MLRNFCVSIFILFLPTLALASQTYSVTKNHDDGSQGTLRWALEESENDGTDSTIRFTVSDVWLNCSQPQLPILRAGRLTLDGSTAPGGEVAIHFRGCFNGFNIQGNRNTFKSLDLEGSRFGVTLIGSSFNLFDRVTSRDGAGNGQGFSLGSGSNNNTLTRCISRNNPHAGFFIKVGSRDNQIGPGNVSRDNGSNALTITDQSSGNQVFGNTFRDNDGGVGIHGSSTGNIIGPDNLIRGNSGTGVSVDSPNNTVQGNAIRDAETFGIRIHGSSDNTLVAGNTVLFSGLHNIHLSDVSHCTVRDNIAAGSLEMRGIALADAPHNVIGPDNLVGLNRDGGILLQDSDPCQVIDNDWVLLNSGAGILVNSSQPEWQQEEILIRGNRIESNSRGILLNERTFRVRVEENLIMNHAGTGLSSHTDWSDENLNTRHTVHRNYLAGNGSGIATFRSGGMDITENWIWDNAGYGITFQHGGADMNIWRNYIKGNDIGIAFVGSPGALADSNRIEENSGIGIYAGETDVTIQNNIIWKNGGAGISSGHNNAPLTVVNNTIVENEVGIDGGGWLRNNILYFNAVADVADANGLDMDYSNVGNFLCGDPDSRQNFSSLPRFVDRAGGDFHLQSHSPCRNAGWNGNGIPDWDFEGDSRPLEGRIDVGADEYNPAALAGGPPVGGPEIPGVQDLVGSTERELLLGGARAGLPVQELMERLGRKPGYGLGANPPVDYVVLNLNDEGPGSLREALHRANTDFGPSRVTFQPGLQGTIVLDGTLPGFSDTFGGTELVGPLLADGETPAITLVMPAHKRRAVITFSSANNIMKNFDVDGAYDTISLHGNARFNLLENLTVRDTEYGLGIGMSGADQNTVRNCRAYRNQQAGFFLSFEANGNTFEDIKSIDNRTGITLWGCHNTTVRGVTTDNRMVRNRWTVVVQQGSRNNSFGPRLVVEDAGFDVGAGVGILVNGMGTSGNTFEDVEVHDSWGTGVALNDLTRANVFQNLTVTGARGSAFKLNSAPFNFVSESSFTGRSGETGSLISVLGCSQGSHILENTLVAQGSRNGISINGTQDVQVRDCEIRGSFADFGSGILLNGDSSNILVDGNTIGTAGGQNPDRGVVLAGSTGAQIGGNLIFLGNHNSLDVDEGIQIGQESHDAVVGPANLIRAVTDQARRGIRTFGDPAPERAFIAGNEILGNDLLERGIEVWSVGDGCRVDANKVRQCTGQGIRAGQNWSLVVQNNLVERCDKGLELPWVPDGGPNPLVLLNTLSCNDVGISGEGRVWMNNIWGNISNDHLFHPDAVVHCNNFGDASGLPGDNIAVDPRFVSYSGCGSGNNYHLRSSSPLKNYSCSGAPPLPAYDADGDSRPQGGGYDIGCDEVNE